MPAESVERSQLVDRKRVLPKDGQVSETRATSRGRGRIGPILLVLFLAFPLATSARARIVRVGVYQNPPKIFLSKSRISGIFGDLIRKIADLEGWTIVPVPCEWAKCLDMVQRGQIDLMPDVAFNERRAGLMSFAKVPALHSWSELYRNPSSEIMTVHDLAGKRLAVLAGSIQERYLKQMLRKFGEKRVQFISTGSLKDAFQLTAEGKADAVATNNYFGNVAARRYHLKGTPILFEPVQLYFAAPKGQDADLLTSINDYLSRWEGDPTSNYFDILAKWKVRAERMWIPHIVWWAMGMLAALLTFVVVITFFLRRKVREKTQTLEISESKHAAILDNVDAYIYIKGIDHRFQYVNKRVADLFGAPAAQIIGQPVEAFFDAETSARIHSVDDRVLRDGERITLEEQNQSKNGDRRTYLSVKQPLRDKGGKIYAVCGISTDFTEHKRNEEKIRRLALYDLLTGLPNRSALLDQAQEAIDAYTRTGVDGALLFLDLDNFKLLNDTLGHIQGDFLLKQAADRLKQCIRPDDTLARLGGDEFVLLIERIGKSRNAVLREVSEITNGLLDAFQAEPCRLESSTHNISISIGAALLSDADHSVEELLKRADMAMYAAKSAGRKRFKFYDPQMEAAFAQRAEIEAMLHDALRLKQFALLYQPQIGSDGRIFGAEALIRWNHPEKGVISPGTFIPIAEVTGQIIEIGDWIFRHACQQLVAWQELASHRHIVLSVNVSARQLFHPDFVVNLINIIEETGADPYQLELELTEFMLIDDVDDVIEKMMALKAIGVRFSLDDFGTGFSSLSYLKRLPLDQLKIDQSFVRDLLDDPNDAAIVRTIIALGNSLGLAVIAEGVETAEQRDALVELGCLRLQGYLFGRPGPSEVLLSNSSDWVANNQSSVARDRSNLPRLPDKLVPGIAATTDDPTERPANAGRKARFYS